MVLTRHTSRLATFTVLMLAASSLYADPTECRLDELARSVEVVYSSPGQAVPCEVLYRKADDGTMETLWRAANEAGYCEARADEFISKLESWGWTCGAATQPSDSELPSRTGIETTVTRSGF